MSYKHIGVKRSARQIERDKLNKLSRIKSQAYTVLCLGTFLVVTDRFSFSSMSVVPFDSFNRLLFSDNFSLFGMFLFFLSISLIITLLLSWFFYYRGYYAIARIIGLSVTLPMIITKLYQLLITLSTYI